MRATLPLIVTLLSLLLWTAEVTSQPTRDIISIRSGGRSVIGTVNGFTPDHLTVDTSSEVKEVPVEDIARMTLGDDPPGLGSLRAAVEAGQFEQANSQLERLKDGDAREIVQQEIAFFRALIPSRLALQGSGEPIAAASKLNAFLKQYPTSFRLYAAWEVMGDLASSLGKFDSAAAAYGKLDGAKSEATRARGLLLQADALLRKGSTAEALEKFQQAARLDGDRTQALAAIGVALCQARSGQPEAGVEALQQVIASHDANDAELFAKAYNALGECYQLAGKNEDAILAFLHTDLLFYRNYDAHAQALFHLSKLWADINKPADAAKARQLLKERYAATSWAKMQ